MTLVVNAGDIRDVPLLPLYSQWETSAHFKGDEKNPIEKRLKIKA